MSSIEGFAYLPDHRLILVDGTDAGAWLHDLLTADVGELRPGRASVALLLSPKGRIRASMSLGALARGFVLIQAPDQPAPIDALLAPYVLSSDVRLTDRSKDLRLFATTLLPATLPAHTLRPSTLNWTADVIVEAARTEEVRDALVADGLRQISAEEAEAWRIRQGLARFPSDMTTDSLPHEAAFGPAIDLDKGCFLGQEAVAKVRNLGHPPWVIRTLLAPTPVERGTGLRAGAEEAGIVTGATSDGGGGWALLARIRWSHRDRALSLPDGTEIGPGSEATGMA